MKKCFALFTAALMMLLCSWVSPDSYAAGSKIKKAKASELEYHYDADLGGVEITKYFGNDKYITFPTSIDGDRVVSINLRSGYAHTPELYEVEIQSGVRSVGISDWPNLEKVKLPESVKELHTAAFAFSKLKSISLPKNVTTISESAFSECDALTEVKAPGVRKIEQYAFYDSDNIKELPCIKNVEYIGMSAFYHCDNLKKITLSNKCKYIGCIAFANCESLTEVTIPSIRYPYNENNDYIGRKDKDNNKLDGIEETVFSGCTSLKKVTTYSYISKCEFSDCKSLQEVIIIPNKADKRYYIGEHAFSNCTSLKTVDLSKVKKPITIGYRAFANCTSLRSLKLPNNCILDQNVFDNCKALTVTYKGKKYTPKDFDKLYELCKEK